MIVLSLALGLMVSSSMIPSRLLRRPTTRASVLCESKTFNITLSDCSCGIGLGLDSLNYVDLLQADKAAARAGVLLGDQVRRWNGVRLWSRGRQVKLKDVVSQPITQSHTLEVERFVLDAQSSPAAAIDHCAHELRYRGFSAIPSRLSPALVTATRLEVSVQLTKLLTLASSLGVNPVESAFTFAECEHRQRLRYDLALPLSRSTHGAEDAAAWDATPTGGGTEGQRKRGESNALTGVSSWRELCERAFELASPAIEACAGVRLGSARLVMAGAVTSRAGAERQLFHVDGAVGLFTVFVPLVEIEQDGDGTEFWAGSHADPAALMLAQQAVHAHAEAQEGLTEGSLLATPAAVPRRGAPTRAESEVTAAGAGGKDGLSFASALEAPPCHAGQPLIFDYRVVHRGLANPCEAEGGRERPVAYIVISVDGTVDDQNFAQQSIHDADKAYVDNLKLWGDSDE